jgi:hypothetical protein
MIMMARNRDHADDPCEAIQLVLHHLAQRTAIASHRGKENDEILYGTAEDDADEDPQGTGQVAKLRRQDGTHERPGTADRRKVMAEDDPFIRLHEILSILVHLARSRPTVIEHQHPGRDPFRVETVADRVRAERRDHDIP